MMSWSGKEEIPIHIVIYELKTKQKHLSDMFTGMLA